MNKLIYVILISIAVISCSKTSQNKSEASVRSFLLDSLKNPSSYESVSFSKIDSVFEADLIKERINRLITLVNISDVLMKSDSSLLNTLKIHKWSHKEQEKYLVSFDKNKKDRDSIRQEIEYLKNKMDLIEVKNNLMGFRITHNYKHRRLDNEIVDLKIDFAIDKDFKVIEYNKGINGKAFFDIKIYVKNDGTLYTEFVIDPKFDDQKINSTGITFLKVKAGTHYLSWTAANKNGLGILTNPETFNRDIVLEESDYVKTFFVINGKDYSSYLNEEEADKDDYKNK